MEDKTQATEPQCTLYTSLWNEGRDRASRLVSARYRATFTALLDQMDQGWGFIRPLQHAAEAWRWNPSLPAAYRAVATFVDTDICDAYRTIAWDCASMVPGTEPYEDVLVLEDTEAEIEVVQRNVTVAALGLNHPDFPASFRPAMQNAAERFPAWMDALQPLLASALDVVGKVEKGMPMPRLLRNGRRERKV